MRGLGYSSVNNQNQRVVVTTGIFLEASDMVPAPTCVWRNVREIKGNALQGGREIKKRVVCDLSKREEARGTHQTNQKLKPAVFSYRGIEQQE